jgi:hypothetical protein
VPLMCFLFAMLCDIIRLPPGGILLRFALIICVFFVLAGYNCGAQHINPNDPPTFDQGAGQWGEWTPIPTFPSLLVREACGDDRRMNGVPVFTLWMQTKNNSADAVAIVWAADIYDPDTNENMVSGSFVEYLDPGQITQAVSELIGSCAAAAPSHAKVKCAATKGSEDGACFQNSQGVRIGQRMDEFRALPTPQYESVEGEPVASNATKVYWVCHLGVNSGDDVIENYHQYTTRDFSQTVADGYWHDRPEFDEGTEGEAYADQFKKWITSQPDLKGEPDKNAYCAPFKTQQRAEDYATMLNKTILVDWSAK